MAWRWRKAISFAIGSLLVATLLEGFSVSPAQAYSPPSSESCLKINDQNELVSATMCSGAVVVPDRVVRVKTGAFWRFRGSVYFGPHSNLQAIESVSFQNQFGFRSIVFPPSLNTVEELSIGGTGSLIAFFQRNPSSITPNSFYMSGDFIIASPYGKPIVTQTNTTPILQSPIQIDCNLIDGFNDYLGTENAILELHNCRDPLNLADPNSPGTMGFVLDEGLTESVNLESVDGLHRGAFRLRQLGKNGHRVAFTKDIDGAGFAESVFGDEFEPLSQAQTTCQLRSATPLPTGLSLTSDCNLVAADTSNLSSSMTDVTVDWTARRRVKNSFEVAEKNASPIYDSERRGSVGVRISLRKNSALTDVEKFQMKLATAKFSGTVRDWSIALEALNSLPVEQVPAEAADTGILATKAVAEFEQNLRNETSTQSALQAFANEAASGSTHLAHLKTRVQLQSAARFLALFETSPVRAKDVLERLIGLPESEGRQALMDRFQARTKTLFPSTTSVSEGVRTVEFNNPYEVQRFTVPAGVTEIDLTLLGAEGSQGGNGRDSPSPEQAGYKGRVTGRMSVTPGQVLTIGVGGAAGDTNRSCVTGVDNFLDFPNVAFGGLNPLGGYAGGNGGIPSETECSGAGGAGGAATVVQIGSSGSPASIATLVAGGSAGTGGSSYRAAGPIGSSTFTARNDMTSTNGQTAQPYVSYAWWNSYYEQFGGGGLGGGGGGYRGGSIGDYDTESSCGLPYDICPLASSPGSNYSAGISGLTESYVRYTFEPVSQANGKVTIAFVEPTVVSPTPDETTPPATHPGSSSDAHPTATPTPTPTFKPVAPESPTGLKAKPLWRAAEVSWSAPLKDGGSPIIEYQVVTAEGVTCSTAGLTCRLTGLTPGQLLQLTVRAKNEIGISAPARLGGDKVFIPLSLNLWQLNKTATGLAPKLLNAQQLRKLRAMVSQDVGGFRLTVRLARNASKLSTAAARKQLGLETKALRAQLRAAGLLGKVSIATKISPPNSKAQRPSVILVVQKPI